MQRRLETTSLDRTAARVCGGDLVLGSCVSLPWQRGLGRGDSLKMLRGGGTLGYPRGPLVQPQGPYKRDAGGQRAEKRPDHWPRRHSEGHEPGSVAPQEAGESKRRNSILQPPGGTQPAEPFRLEASRTRMINLCCFQAPRLYNL